MTSPPSHIAPPSPGQSPDGLPPLRDVIRTHGLAAKKSLGQNFIQDLNLTRKIARIGPVLAGATVVEIGPGPGGLTRGLLLEGAAEVIAIERDDRCLPALEEISQRYPDRLKVHAEDALKIDWTRLLESAVSKDVRIVANLPYGVATRLLVSWLETEPWPPWFTRMTLMFQKEVAERIVAAPGTPAYGRLSVIAQWRTHARIALTLSPAAFSPPPKVESAVVDFEPRSHPMPVCDVRTLGRVTAAAFGQRRKMLRSTLKPLFREPGALERTLADLGIAGERRGETLTIEDFARLAAAVDAIEAAQAPSR